MLNLEQVKLLETKVTKAIEYVERVTGENAALQAKLDSYQKRIDELEVVVMRFKEDQGRIEDGILSALDRLNRFESAVEKSLKDKTADAHAAAEKTATAAAPKPEKVPPLKAAAVPAATAVSAAKSPEKTGSVPSSKAMPKTQAAAAPSIAGEMFFEIPEAAAGDDIVDPLGGEDSSEFSDENSEEEPDIF